MEKIFGKILKTQTMLTVKQTLSQFFSQEFSEIFQQSFFIKYIRVIFPRWMMNKELDMSEKMTFLAWLLPAFT